MVLKNPLANRQLLQGSKTFLFVNDPKTSPKFSKSRLIKPEIGMVRIHAQSSLIVTPHRTADIRFVQPAPIMAPVMVCVVDTGILKC